MLSFCSGALFPLRTSSEDEVVLGHWPESFFLPGCGCLVTNVSIYVFDSSSGSELFRQPLSSITLGAPANAVGMTLDNGVARLFVAIPGAIKSSSSSDCTGGFNGGLYGGSFPFANVREWGLSHSFAVDKTSVSFLATGTYAYASSAGVDAITFLPPKIAGANVSFVNVGYGMPISTSSLLTSAFAYQLTAAHGEMGVLQLLDANGQIAFRYLPNVAAMSTYPSALSHAYGGALLLLNPTASTPSGTALYYNYPDHGSKPMQQVI